jgi:hypothetical protein
MSRQSDLESMPEAELIRSNRAEMLGETLERLIDADEPRRVAFLHDLAIRLAPKIEAGMPPVNGEEEDVPVEWPDDEAECQAWPDEQLLGLMLKAGGGGIVERTLEARYGDAVDSRGNRTSEAHYAAMELAHFLSLAFGEQTARQRAYCIATAIALLEIAFDGMPPAHDPRLN